ncbi:MAG: N-acetyl-gamma-glutamyl-phosphate reductase [SAR324 cluster bacterium]|nr:N-acetyl-gamma-glutamyl-phosphate reductase [SAR324 cluster bacterium]
MKHKIFIDGAAGTTGLKIRELLLRRDEIELIELADDKRKDPAAKAQAFGQAEVAILCLDDANAVQSVALAQDSEVRIIDASTAHRVHPDWVYGLAELGPDQRGKIKEAKYVSNPGCYPTGALLALKPLIAKGLLTPEILLNIFAISGYSGGGRKLIEAYEANSVATKSRADWAARPYALGLQHKHTPEIQVHSGLNTKPIFCPVVGDFAQGMIVQIPLFSSQIQSSGDAIGEIFQIWQDYYGDENFVSIAKLSPDEATEAGFLSAVNLVGTNQVELMAFGHSDQCMLVARLDNLGKGASGACVQNLNLMLGLEEATSLV